MGEKVQRIVIDYDFKTDKVVAAKAALQSAQTVADKFESTTAKAGRAAEQSYSSATRSIVVMKQELERLKFRIENTSGADKKRLIDLSAQYKKLDADIKKTTDSLFKQEQAIKASAKSTKDLASQFGNAYTAVKLFLTAGLVREVISASLEMAKLSGTMVGVQRAFDRLPNSVLLLDDLKRATRGTVGDLELMQKALTAQNFRIPLQNLSTLLEFAAVKAQQTGQEVNHLVDFIVSGIGLRSIKRLDDLGFTANRVKEALGGVTLQAASMEKVMSAVTQLMNEDLEKTGGFAETSATKVEALTVAWQELKLEVSKQATQDGGFIDFMRDSIEGLRLALLGEGGRLKEIIADQAVALVQLFKQGLGQDAIQNIEAVQQKLNSTVQIIGRYNDQIQDLKDTIALGEGFGFPGFSKENQAGAAHYTELVEKYGNKAKGVFEKEIADARQRLNLWVLNREILEASIPILKGYLKTLEDGSKQIVEQLGLIAAKQAEIESTGDALQAAKSTTEISRLNNELAKLNGELADLKAFGTTKQFLSVGGEIQLVPVVAQGSLKKLETDLKAEPLFKEGVVIPVTIGGQFVENKGIDTRAATDQFQASIDEMIRNMPEGLGKVTTIPIKPVFVPSEWDLIADEFAENWQNIVGQGLSNTTDIINASFQAEADSYTQRLNEARAYYDRLMILAGDNENAKDRLRLRSASEEKRLRQQAFEADKRAKSASAVINGAAGVINAFATLPYPAAIVAAVLIAAETAAQLAVISQQKPRFAKGVIDLKGPGTGTSDSIDARLSRGESVMTAEETKNSMGILKAVKAKRLNDKVLADFKLTGEGVKYVGMDDKRIVREIQELKNSQPDYKELNGMLYRTRKKGEAYKQWVRTRAMG